MKKTISHKRLWAALAAVTLMAALASPAGAALAGKTIEVLTGVTIYVDGVEMKPTDANGNPVETFVYNGTTYIPLRAVSQSLGKNVNWDGKTQSVYIGEQPGMKQYLPDVLEPYQSVGYSAPSTISMAGQKYAHCIQLGADGEGYATYNLNGQYQSLSFDAGIIDDARLHDVTLNIYLDGELSFSADLSYEDLPRHFDVPLYGALQMKIELVRVTSSIWGSTYGLANVEIN